MQIIHFFLSGWMNTWCVACKPAANPGTEMDDDDEGK